jgi:hypothetical protein
MVFIYFATFLPIYVDTRTKAKSSPNWQHFASFFVTTTKSR